MTDFEDALQFEIRHRFLAALLRIADECDITHNRTHEIIYYSIDPKEQSETEFKKHLSISGIGQLEEKHKIYISAIDRDPKGARALREVPQKIQSEYELGTNVFEDLHDWGVKFIGIHMQPGTGYGTSWLPLGPYRLFAPVQNSGTPVPVYYADYLPVPGIPGIDDDSFFNVVTEIRDNAGYEWYPDNNVPVSIDRGTTQLKRAFDSMILATLFTHEQLIQPISPLNWNGILTGVLEGVAPYKPVFVTMDKAAQYVRAIYNSNITSSMFNPQTNILITGLSGATDMITQFYLFTEKNGVVVEQRVNVPVFSGTTYVYSQVPGCP